MLKWDTNSTDFVKIAQGIRPCGAFIFGILIKYESKFQFWESYTLIVTLIGVKYGMEEWIPMLNFTPIGAMCRPCGAKNLKIVL